MQNFNCCVKVHFSPIPRSIEAFNPGFLKMSPTDVLCFWSWLAKTWTCLHLGHNERPVLAAAGLSLTEKGISSYEEFESLWWY